jgi:DNA-binding transcriptional regulator YdaS (Cro superfamily)
MSAPEEQAGAQSDWVALLNQAVADEKRTGKVRGAISRVADRLGMSRSAVSTAMRGCYPGSTVKIEARVLRTFGGGQVVCPHLRRAIALAECEGWQTRAQPRSNPDALRHWTACKNCPQALAGTPAKQEAP